MTPVFVIVGKLNREYILPPQGSPVLDEPGGNLLYAAGGLAVWDSHIGLLSRVGKDYPSQWITGLEERGFDIKGIRVQPHDLDLRSFAAYTDSNERSRSSVVSHFTRRQMTFPKSLLGYQSEEELNTDPRKMNPASPTALDIPKEYLDVSHIHLCPLDFNSQSQLVNVFKAGSNQTVSLDPALNYMNQTFWRDLRLVLQGVMVFQPSEEEMRALFWGETNDLWDMMNQISEFGPQIIVVKRGGLGQMIFDAAGKHRYEVPAYPSRLADPTGAGDSFCGGYLVGFQKTNDPLMAAVYGNVSASLKVEGSGPFYPLSVLPGLAEARLNSLRQLVRKL